MEHNGLSIGHELLRRRGGGDLVRQLVAAADMDLLG
jgi:hypothetical protein